MKDEGVSYDYLLHICKRVRQREQQYKKSPVLEAYLVGLRNREASVAGANE